MKLEPNEIILRIIDNKLFKGSFFLFAIIYSLSHIYFGLDFTDTFYWLNMLDDYSKYPMTSGTLYIGKIIGNLFSDNLITFRLFTWLFGLLAFIIPFLFLIPEKSQYLNYLSLSIILIRNPIFGPDITTLFFASIIATSIIWNYNKNKISIEIFNSIIISFLIFVRFPNIIVLFIYIFITLINNKVGIIYKFRIFLLVLTSVILSSYLIIIILHDSTQNYFDILNDQINNSVLNSNYTLSSLLKRYIEDFIKILIGSLFLILIDYIYRYRKNRKSINRILIQSFTITLFIAFCYFFIYKNAYRWYDRLFLTSIFMYLLFVAFKYKNLNYNNLHIILIISSLALTSISGSNTGFLKFSPLIIAFLPTIIYYLKIENNLNNLNTNIYPYIATLLVCFMLCHSKPYEDSRFIYLRKTADSIPKLKNILTTSERIDFVNDVLVNSQNYENIAVVYLGNCSHIFNYLTKSETLNIPFKMEMTNINEIDMFINSYYKGKPVIFYIPNYPPNEINQEDIILNKYMLSIGYNRIEKRCYNIYTK